MGRLDRAGLFAGVILGLLFLTGCSTDDPNEPISYSGSAFFFVKNGLNSEIEVVVESSFGVTCQFVDGVLLPGERLLICEAGGNETPATALTSLKIYVGEMRNLIFDHTPVVDSAWDQYEGPGRFDIEYEFFPHGI